MPKKHVTISQQVMSRIQTEHVVMKPRWYFVAGSLFMMAGLVSFTVVAVFLANLTLFMFRKHGPMGQWRLEQMLSSFPWWIPLLAIIGVVSGVVMLKKYDFSYKKNFPLIIAGFIASVLIAGYTMDHFGLNETWLRRGPMRRLYQQLDARGGSFPARQGRKENGSGNGFFRQYR